MSLSVITDQPQPQAQPKVQQDTHPDPQSHLQSPSAGDPQPQSQPQPQMQARPQPPQRPQEDVTQQFIPPGTSGESVTSPQAITSNRPKLVRRDYAVDLTAARQQFEHARMVKQAVTGNKLDIATPRHMENLIHWLESGVAPKSLHLECDFGGPHCYDDPDYDDREVLAPQLLMRLLHACRGISKLVFDECRLSQESFRQLGAYLMQEDCKLQVLGLLDHEIDDKSAGHLAQALRMNRSLREFSLGGAFARVSSMAMEKILHAVASTPSIITLQLEHIRGCMIWPSQLESVLASGSRVQLTISSPYRVRLLLRDYSYWNQTFAAFCQQLAKDTGLHSLDLSGWDLTAENIDALLAALQANAHLERLELGRIVLTDEQRVQITRCLELNEANNLAKRQVAEWQGAKVLDGLVPALLAAGDVWPRELSHLIASMMDAATLEDLKKSGAAPMASGKPVKDKRSKSPRQ